MLPKSQAMNPIKNGSYSEAARSINRVMAEYPWLAEIEIENVIPLAKSLKLTHSADLTLIKSLNILLNFEFHFLEEDLKNRDLAGAIQTAFRIGMHWSAILAKVGWPKSPGPKRRSHWKIAEEIFRRQEKAGKRMTEGKLWLLCKDVMESAKKPVSRESFGRTYKRNAKKWR